MNVVEKIFGRNDTGENTGGVETGEGSTTGAALDTPIKRGRGRPRLDGTTGERSAGSQRAASPGAAKIVREMEALFSPENFKALVRAPADIRLAVTGRKYWELKDAEVESLAITASTSAKYFAVADPKWLALAMFATNAALIYGSRIAQDLRDNKKDETN